MPTQSLDLINLDHEAQKESLKAFLRTQDIFRDYDFDGSDFAVLLDLLVLNTSKNAFMTNMLFAESFLDSARLRASVVSHAKNLNYVPRSARSSKATVRVSFTASGLSQPYVIPKGSSFATLVKNQSYVFSLADNVIVTSNDTQFTFDCDIYEGTYLKDVHQFDAAKIRYRISNKSVDTTSIAVTVFEDNKIIGDQYRMATSLLDLTAASKVFFLQATENGSYEIVFGNGVLGYKPKAGSTVVIDYRVTVGARADGAMRFVNNFDPTAPANELSGNVSVVTLTSSGNGADQESIESIRYNAPRHFQAQERATIPSDYEALLKNAYPEINAVSAVGGEDMVPQQFGKVFVAVDLQNFIGELPDSKKQQYKTFLRSRGAARPVILSPDYVYLDLTVDLQYNINLTTSTIANIRTLVASKIGEYYAANYNRFGPSIDLSDLMCAIDDADSSIISNVTKYRLYKKVKPLLSPSTNAFQINFNTPLELNNNLPLDVYQATSTNRMITGRRHAVNSNKFLLGGSQVSIEDDNIGKLRVVQSDGQYDSKVLDIGSIDYDNGMLTVDQLTVDSVVSGDFLELIVTPRSPDLAIDKHTILKLEPNRLTINVKPVSR